MLKARMTPLSGCVGRERFSPARKASQLLPSRRASESCVVYRPAVSTSTASSVNHQSQYRVPPTPATGCATPEPARGKFRPELTSAVVLPAPGGPMITYQGSS